MFNCGMVTWTNRIRLSSTRNGVRSGIMERLILSVPSTMRSSTNTHSTLASKSAFIFRLVFDLTRYLTSSLLSICLFQIRENDLGNVHGWSGPSRFSPANTRRTPLWWYGPRNVIRAGTIFHEIRLRNWEVTIGASCCCRFFSFLCSMIFLYRQWQKGRVHVLPSGARRVGLRRRFGRGLR